MGGFRRRRHNPCMQNWRHHQILGPNGALAETLGNDDEGQANTPKHSTTYKSYAEDATHANTTRRGAPPSRTTTPKYLTPTFREEEGYASMWCR